MATETKTISMYDGEINVIFYPNSHRYKVDGTWVKSVTKVLGILDKPWLERRIVKEVRTKLEEMVQNGEQISQDNIYDIYNAHRKKSDEALTIGSATHDWIENFINQVEGHGEDIPADENVANGVIAFLDWCRQNEVEFHASEQMVYSRKYRYVGTFDAIATVNGKKTLIDFKTSKGFYPFDHGLQLAAYRSAYEEEHGEGSIEEMILLHVDKVTGDFGAYSMGEHYEEMKEFFNTLSFVNYEKARLEKILKK